MIKKLKALWGTTPLMLLKRRLFRFQRLIKNYGTILELLDDLAEKQGGGFVLDKQYLVALSNKLFDLADTMVYDLNVLAREQYLDYYDMLDCFKKETKELISGRPIFLQSEIVIPLAEIKEFLPQHIGSKNASLLDIHQRLEAPIPEGFAITYSAHQLIIKNNKLSDVIKSAVDKFHKNDPAATEELLAAQEKLRSSAIPSELEEKVYHVLKGMTEKFGDLMFTMDFTTRSESFDSKGDETDYTKTISTINTDRVFDLYREEIANLYDPAQVYFRRMKRMDETAFLAAVCKRMIRGKAAGKLYTLDPKCSSRKIQGIAPLSVENNPFSK